jgi:serine/threonine protein kinase
VNPEERIKALYLTVRQQPSDTRAAFLATVCGDDQTLRREIETLLAQDDATQLTIPQSPIVPDGSQFGPYKIESVLGAGGMGTVYRAVDTRLGRKIAVKISRGDFSGRFAKEARAISALNHPNICTIHDVGPNYLVMELLDGFTLADEIKKGPMSISSVARYGAQIASALVESHSHRIVHRDLKPRNIMVTRHGVKVLDFGLAKVVADVGITETQVLLGTPAYMAPEQVEGREANSATDLFALGLVLYEMATGTLPFPEKSLGHMMAHGSVKEAPRLSNVRHDVPPRLDMLVARLLARDPALRVPAEEAVAELSALIEKIPASTPSQTYLRKPLVPSVAVVTILAMLAGGFWFYRRSETRRWAREDAIPEINKLYSETKSLAAFRSLLKAEKALPADPDVAKLAQTITRVTSVNSSVPGVQVEIQDYLSPDGAWMSLGTTPIARARIPGGYFRWKISKPGVGEFVSAPLTADSMTFPMDLSRQAETGMVAVPGGFWGNMIGFIGWVGYALPPFDMDKFELTNREYQQFVDQGGYQKREYWKEKFKKDGKELTFEQAMELLRDSTGRPGPSTWEAGHFPQGKDNYPVTGVSWYEASAYAAFAGKSLPAIGEWFKAAPSETAKYSTNQSNFGGKGPMPVGASQAVGPYGTYDLTGNVREWCLNADEKENRFILGGAWGTQTYQAYEPEALPPFDRSPQNGFRDVINREPLPPASAGPVARQFRDFSKVKPANDDVFRVYKSLYAYDKRPLNPESGGTVDDNQNWKEEKVTIDAGYGSDRLPLFLFLPKNVHPPYQTVLFFPSARVSTMKDSKNLGDLTFVDYVIKSGRAVVYPIYRATYERRSPGTALPGTLEDRELTIQESKEVRRALDYLETRPDIADMNKVAYLGVSQGTAYGIIFTALEERFKAVVFLDGGYFLGPALPGRDQADFAPRLHKPVLMVNGKYDFTFPPDQSQRPMFDMIGTAPSDKSRKLLDTPHDVSQLKPELSREVLAFLDKYLGRVN